MSAKDGGAAFPLFFPEAKNPVGKILRSREESAGMSLRDYFAAKAMQAEMITTFSDATPAAAEAFSKGAAEAGHTVKEHLAYNAYQIADAMLAERAK